MCLGGCASNNRKSFRVPQQGSPRFQEPRSPNFKEAAQFLDAASPKNAVSTGCLLPLRIDFSEQGPKVPLYLGQTKPNGMRGGRGGSTRFSLGTRCSSTALLVSSGCALPTHFPTRRPKLREKQAISKRVHNKKPENMLHFKVSFILPFS